MRVLVVTGDKSFAPGHERYELQRSAVDELAVLYWGRGNLWPKAPAGKFDVVTSQDPFWRGLFAWVLARVLKAKLNIQVHADLAAQPLVRHILAQVVLRHADSIRVVSEKIKRQVEHVGVKAPIHVLPIYIDVQRFQTVAPVVHEGKVVLWLGRFEKEKDPLLALEVFKEVQKSIDAKLLMAGKGSMESELKEKAKGLPVEFLPWQDPAPLYAQADVVLSTSPYESYGASILEALSAGVPVICLDVGVAREAGAVVADNQTLAQEVIKVLQSGTRAELKIPLFSKAEWRERWQKTLL